MILMIPRKAYVLKKLKINHEILSISVTLLSVLTLAFVIRSLINWIMNRKEYPIVTDQSRCVDYDILHQISYAAKVV